MLKKATKALFLLLKWTSFALGSFLLLILGYLAIISFAEIGMDVSKRDLGHQFSLEKKKPLQEQLPNILIIMADDLGYGDLGCYGGKVIKTPNLDSLARRGMRFTDHYAGASVCSPSRYAMLTGRYPTRGGFSSLITPTDLPYSKKLTWHLGKAFNKLGTVDMGADSKYNGLLHKEITIAEALKKRGYKTGMSGKWHLGDLKTRPEFNPMHHGFDDFLGLNVANDEFPAALFDRDSQLIENINLEQDFLTRIFTERAIEFIDQAEDSPFFYFLSYTAPHLPLIPSEKFKGKSAAGVYGDVVEEMDWYIGQLLNHLEEKGLLENTLIVFTSDNGPWFKGSPGGFRGRKGQSYEGGYRVPFIASWKGVIPENSLSVEPVMNIDLYPSLLDISGLELPQNHVIDGKNITPILLNKDSSSLERPLFFYHFDRLEAVRQGKWKYYSNTNHYVWPIPLDRKGLITNDFAEPWFGIQYGNLYNLELDPAENYDLAHHHPEVVEKLRSLMEKEERGHSGKAPLQNTM